MTWSRCYPLLKRRESDVIGLRGVRRPSSHPFGIEEGWETKLVLLGRQHRALPSSYPRNAAWQCQLALALRLRGLLVVLQRCP